MNYKIAAVTQDGLYLSSHFGMAPLYRVFTIEDGRIVAEEQRPKPHHGQHPQHHHGSEQPHADMFAPIRDCRVLLCGGMGSPAYQKALEAGLEVVLTGGEIASAVQAYLQGRIDHDPRRIHHH